MTEKALPGGTVHRMPSDIRKALTSDKKALFAWEQRTPLARNEWICWVTSVKKAETREEHVKRLISELKEGVRRPCCWIGCIHRKDKPISPSVQGILEKKKSR
ncbi:MAG: YdeI/OmpD-associated family protein [Patescibacteria group bacterium]